MTRRIRVLAERCIACHLCEMACAARKHGTADPERAVIHVTRTYSGGEATISAEWCDRCDRCLDKCPRGIVYDEKGFIEVDFKPCTSCSACQEACPAGAMVMVNSLPEPCEECVARGVVAVRRELPVYCDFCAGDPECVKWCPREAIVVEEIDVYVPATPANVARESHGVTTYHVH